MTAEDYERLENILQAHVTRVERFKGVMMRGVINRNDILREILAACPYIPDVHRQEMGELLATQGRLSEETVEAFTDLLGDYAALSKFISELIALLEARHESV